MKTIIIGLKTDIISAHPIYPVGSIKDIIYLNLENPTVELSEEDANLVLIGANGNVFQIVGESETPDLTKEQLQALFLQTIGTQPSKRLDVDALKSAIDEFNKDADKEQQEATGLSSVEASATIQ